MVQLRRVIFSGVLLLSFLCGQSFANILPISSYSNAWQGSHTFDNDDGLVARVDFAVYDISDYGDLEDDEIELSNMFGATDKRYIYAYQVLTHSESTTAIASFKIQDNDGQSVDDALISDIGTIDPVPFDPVAQLGIEPDDILANGEWLFPGFDLVGSERSWFLVFASDAAPTRGTYEITPATGVIGIPGEPSASTYPTPEPVSILLLGSGFLVVRRRRKSVRV